MISRTGFCNGLLALCFCLGLACRGSQKLQPPPPGQIALKVMTLTFGGDIYGRGRLISSLTGEKFKPPTYAYHSTEVVAFDPKLPFPRSLRVIWTTWKGAFGPAGEGGSGRSYGQMKVSEWGHDATIQVNGPVPENPEHLLLIFYPDGSVKSEILSHAQVDAGRMDQIIEDFRKTWPEVIQAEKADAKKKEGERP